jgi:hypothetical protein
VTAEQAIEAMRNARLEWGMVCPCTCEECDRFYKAVSAIEDALEPKKCEIEQMKVTALKTALRQCWASLRISKARQEKLMADFDNCSTGVDANG